MSGEASGTPRASAGCVTGESVSLVSVRADLLLDLWEIVRDAEGKMNWIAANSHEPHAQAIADDFLTMHEARLTSGDAA